MVEEYIRRKAVLDVATDWCPDDDGSVGKNGDLREMLDELEAIPAADVIPRDEAIKAYFKGVKDGMTRRNVRTVVLCRDCEEADHGGMGNGTVWCNKMERALEENGWCAWGWTDEAKWMPLPEPQEEET